MKSPSRQDREGQGIRTVKRSVGGSFLSGGSFFSRSFLGGGFFHNGSFFRGSLFSGGFFHRSRAGSGVHEHGQAGELLHDAAQEPEGTHLDLIAEGSCGFLILHDVFQELLRRRYP